MTQDEPYTGVPQPPKPPVPAEAPAQEETTAAPGEVSRQAYEQAAADDARFRQQQRELAAMGDQIKPDKDLAGYRSFVFPQVRNAKYLAKVGKLISFPDPNSPTGRRDAGRDGDVWVEVNNGVCVSNNPIVIEWCERHTKKCREASDKRAPAWAALKGGQMPRDDSEATIDGELDVDEMLYGDEPDPSKLGEAVLREQAGSTVEAARVAAKRMQEEADKQAEEED